VTILVAKGILLRFSQRFRSIEEYRVDSAVQMTYDFMHRSICPVLSCRKMSVSTPHFCCSVIGPDAGSDNETSASEKKDQSMNSLPIMVVTYRDQLHA